MTALQEKLSSTGNLSKTSIGLLIDNWKKVKSLKPRELLTQSGETEHYLYFVNVGCVRLYLVDQEGRDSNIGFGYTNTLITSFPSFIEETPSKLRLESFLETELIGIHKKDLSRLMHESAEISQWYTQILEKTLSGHINRQIELLTLSPADRYKAFMERSGHLINTIPLKHIASYLMMSPETLSRMRTRIS